MITLLRNAAMNALAYKQELELVRQQNIDVTEFEEKLLGFQEGFNRNYDLASRKFQTAIDEIDATIKHLQKVKDLSLIHICSRRSAAECISTQSGRKTLGI